MSRFCIRAKCADLVWRARYDIALLWRRFSEWILLTIVCLLPNHVKYRAAIDVVAYATTGKYSSTVVPDLTAMEAIGRFERDKLRKEASLPRRTEIASICDNCRHYHDRFYGNNWLCCAMHPNGPDLKANCRDWEGHTCE